MKFLVILLPALLLSACGQNESAPADNPARVDQSTAATAATAKANGAGLPDYAPQYPGSVIVEQSTKDFADFSSTEIHMTTSDAVGKISDFYRASLAKSELDANNLR